MEMCDQLHAPAALPPGNNLGTPLKRRLGGPQSLSGRFGKEKNVSSLPAIKPRIVQPILRISRRRLV